MPCVLNYYKRSISCVLLALLWLGAGCAGANQVARSAPHLAFAELNGPRRKQAIATIASGPTVIHFKQGERIPVALGLDSQLLELEAPKLTLIARRDFDLLLRPDGALRISADGDFESARENYFMFGFDVEAQAETLLRVKFGVQPETRP